MPRIDISPEGFDKSWRFLLKSWGERFGLLTMVMAEAAGPNGNILSVEPNPKVADMLENSIKLMGWSERETMRELEFLIKVLVI